MEQLQSKLHSYSLFGLPKVPRQLSFHQDSWEEGEGETSLAMEDSWQMLLDDPQVPAPRLQLCLTTRGCVQQASRWSRNHVSPVKPLTGR